MPQPNFQFATRARHLYTSRCAKKTTNKRFDRWLYLKRSNIVMHTSIKQTPARHHRMSAIYRTNPPIKLDHNPLMVAANLDKTKSSRPHYRLRTPSHAYDGKFLVFGTGNIIVAGTKSHSAAALGSIRMLRLLAQQSNQKYLNIWPSIISVPNAVITGRLKGCVDKSIKLSEFANSTPKFPGIALRVPQPRITPELYLRRNIIIIPGITTSESLISVIESIEKIVAKHQSPIPTSKITHTLHVSDQADAL